MALSCWKSVCCSESIVSRISSSYFALAIGFARVTKACERAKQARKDSEDEWMQLLLLGTEHDATKEAAAKLEAEEGKG